MLFERGVGFRFGKPSLKPTGIGLEKGESLLLGTTPGQCKNDFTTVLHAKVNSAGTWRATDAARKKQGALTCLDFD